MEMFLEHLEVERNVSRLTIRNYRHYLQTFVDWLAGHQVDDITVFDLELLRKYRLYLNRLTTENGDQLSKKTQGYYLISLRSFLKWLAKNDVECLSPEKIDLPKGKFHILCRNLRHTLGNNISPDMMYCNVYPFEGVTS